MRDPLTLRILGLLLLAAGAAFIGLGYFGYLQFNYKLGGGIAAGIGASLIVFSAFYRRGRHGLTGKTEKRTGKPSAMKRLAMFWGGAFLVIVSPIVGAIPGPGGIVVFAAGFGLMLRGSRWVKKKYARFKRRHPKKGDWADFGLQRGSYKRRQARLKAEAAAAPPAERESDLSDLEPGCKR
jgi:hypothetical protein